MAATYDCDGCGQATPMAYVRTVSSSHGDTTQCLTCLGDDRDMYEGKRMKIKVKTLRKLIKEEFQIAKLLITEAPGQVWPDAFDASSTTGANSAALRSTPAEQLPSGVGYVRNAKLAQSYDDEASFRNASGEGHLADESDLEGWDDVLAGIDADDAAWDETKEMWAEDDPNINVRTRDELEPIPESSKPTK